jgi:hypothetical protein
MVDCAARRHYATLTKKGKLVQRSGAGAGQVLGSQRENFRMRIFVVLMAACVLFAACSSSSPENPIPGNGTSAEAGIDTGTDPGSMGPGPDAAMTTDETSSPVEASGSGEDGMTQTPSGDAAAGMDADDTGLADAQSADDAASPPDAGQVVGDGGYGPNWKLICPNSMPPATCCSVYCGCMSQRCATETKGGFPGGKDCMSFCLTVGPTLKRGPISTGIQFLVCECSEAGNPAVPFEWMSHCGHALGMNGGSCKY